MADEVTRHIKDKVRNALWGKSAGRCQFNGCNRLLYQSSVTLENVNISEAAHIYSFSKKGPRGWGTFIFNKDTINDINNLMLMCHDCHKTIDQDIKGEKYSASLLKEWKEEHEKRVLLVTGISPTNKSHVVFYGANIGEQQSPLQYIEAVSAMFPRRYPVDLDAIKLSMSSNLRDSTQEYWMAESAHLDSIFSQLISPKINSHSDTHFSLFSLAPIPLLIKLGCLFTDKIDVETYQPIREPKTWAWQRPPENFNFEVVTPTRKNTTVALVLSLSAHIDHQRVYDVIGSNTDIFEIKTTSHFQHNDFIRSPTQLSELRTELRSLIENITSQYGLHTALNIFPAMPVSCAIELGRIRMPKASMPWIIYDQNYTSGKFEKTITI